MTNVPNEFGTTYPLFKFSWIVFMVIPPLKTNIHSGKAQNVVIL